MTTRAAALTTPGSATDIIRRATNAGRAIIPFLGAGLSAASGFPLINELRDYLCKVRFLIEGGVYRHFLGEQIARPQGADSPQYYPARFIDSFGWPDFNQIDADLWWFFIDEIRPNNIRPAAIAKAAFGKRHIERFPRHPDLDSAFDQFKSQLSSELLWGNGRWCLQSAVRHVILDDIQFHDSKLAELIRSHIWSMQLKPRIDWFRYLLDLVGGRRGLVDALFTQLNNLRQPSLGHIMLAQLASEFGWRLHLTINFDTLLETAFRREQLNPTVFEVSRDTEPPDPALVNRSELALIKLHGSSFDLRIGEPIDHSLDEPTRNHIFGCVPEDALLLVLGFSGDERRMMQLLEELVLRREVRSPNKVRILWMHWEAEEELPATVVGLRQKLEEIGRGKEFRCARLTDAGLFLLEAYQSLSSTLPLSLQPYTALPKRVFSREAVTINENVDRTFQLFARSSLAQDDDTRSTINFGMILDSNVPSIQMSAFAQSQRNYHVIWIDLEDHHTVSGIVGEILNQMRAFDPHLPHLVLPVDDNLADTPVTQSQQRRFEKSARYIRRALRRGRYILAFDSVEGFGREQTAHHGLPADVVPHSQRQLGVRESLLWERHRDLLSFFEDLLKGDDPNTDMYSDWYCCFAVDEPSYRHIVRITHDEVTQSVFLQMRRALVHFCALFCDKANRHAKWIPNPIKENSPRSKGSNAIDDPLSSFLTHIRELNSSSPKSTRQLSGITKNGRGPSDSMFHWALLPVLDPSIVVTEDHALGVFLVLAAFRRPRSLASLYSVLTDLYRIPNTVGQPVKTVDSATFDRWFVGVLTSLQRTTPPLIKVMDGGFFWILHHLHEWTYKLLSECVRRQCVDSLRTKWLEADTKVGCGNRLTRLMCLIVIHSRIARFYYIHAYKRSRDIAGLYEYLYHRISALKYVSTLSGAIAHTESKLSGDEVILLELENHATEWCVRDGLLRGQNDSKTQTKITPKEAAALARRNYLQRLLNVLKREESTIVSRGIADTWLSWIEMLRTELERLQKDSAALKRVSEVDTAEAVVVDLTWILDKLGVQLLREKGARRRCAEQLLQLMSIIIDPLDHALGRLRESPELSPRMQSLTDEFRSSWGEFNRSHNRPGQKGESLDRRGFPEGLVEKMGAFIACVHLLADSTLLIRLLHPRDMTSVTIGMTRFFWCFRQCCACLRHYVSAKKVDEWLQISLGWLLLIEEILGIVEEKQWTNVARRRRPLRAEIQQHILEYAFDRLRYEIEASLSRPFTRRRFSAFGEQQEQTPIEGKETKWQIADRCLREAENWRLSVYGTTFAEPNRLAQNQCEFRSLIAECRAFSEDYNGALRELRLAISALRRHSPSDQFHQAIILGLKAETYLLRSDAHLRRDWLRAESKWRPRFSPQEAYKRRRRAREDLRLANTNLNASQDLIRDIRSNVSRWAWLYEIRAQLVVERILLRALELDFEIDVALDDWKTIGSVQREITEGLESIRAGLDCTIYPHHLPTHTDSFATQAETQHINELHKRLLGLWMALMVASFWTLRFLSVGPSTPTKSRYGSRHAPRLAAMERFGTSGSRDSFWSRWTALNQAAGLRRFVDKISDIDVSVIPTNDSTTEFAGDVALKALEALSSVGDLLVETSHHPPSMLREFIVQKISALCDEEQQGTDWVSRLQKAIRSIKTKAF